MRHNKEQEKAIWHKEGPAMVLAGPGAGKTYVITNRVKTLIEKQGVAPQNILVVTFSKAAAVEMKERFDAMTAGRKMPVLFGTFHSVFFQILRLAYHYEAKDIVTPPLKYRFLEEALRDSSYEVEDQKEFLEDIEKEISKVKGEGIDVGCYYSANCPEQVFRDLYQGYQQRLQQHRCLDFDDMIVYTYQLLSQREDILQRWQQRFQYILIDEFQDINRLQYEAIQMIAEPENNLFIVGDDDQSIYGFRGARPDIMLAFPRRFQQTRKITLGTNYRCSSQILKAADLLIRHNKKRFAKDLHADKGSREGVHIKGYRNLPSEAEGIVSKIQTYAGEGMEYTEMAVLFRTNLQMRIVSGKLMEHGIPFSMNERIPNIFDTWMAKDLLSYIKIALGEKSRNYFLKICNRPVRYMSRSAFTEPEVDFDDLRAYYARKGQGWMIERVQDFQNELRTIKTLNPFSAIHYIRNGIGYNDFLEEYAKERNVNVEDWFEMLDEIQETARDKISLTEWLAFVDSYGEQLEKIGQENRQRQSRQKGVSLLTMHGAKGLEFQTVFIPTVNEEISPYRKAIQSGGLEEERRLLYVAMTRAKEHLHMSFVKERFHKETEPSRFLYEIMPELGKKPERK